MHEYVFVREEEYYSNKPSFTMFTIKHNAYKKTQYLQAMNKLSGKELSQLNRRLTGLAGEANYCGRLSTLKLYKQSSAILRG